MNKVKNKPSFPLSLEEQIDFFVSCITQKIQNWNTVLEQIHTQDMKRNSVIAFHFLRVGNLHFCFLSKRVKSERVNSQPCIFKIRLVNFPIYLQNFSSCEDINRKIYIILWFQIFVVLKMKFKKKRLLEFKSLGFTVKIGWIADLRFAKFVLICKSCSWKH